LATVFPLALDLAADRIPFVVSCGVLGFYKQAFYQWRADPLKLGRRTPDQRRYRHPP
jgi:hypothetical protein